MAKTQLTTDLEKQIYIATAKQGVFGCFEVTIGWYGKERVDYLTYDTKGIWRFYEIKVSKADFNSKANKTFLGHYNYYVMTKDLYEEVKDEVPNHLGVYIRDCLVKRAKKQELGVDEQILKDSMIRSLYREVDKQIRSNNPTLIESMERRLRNSNRERDKYRDDYWRLMRIGESKYGSRWYREDEI